MSRLSQIIRAEIAASGVLSFARFMELALYCPEFGYYETQKDNIGRGGDFITSVSAGGLFGQLLAFQFAGWLEELRIADCGLRIVEAGAHDGTLAKDILNWLKTNRQKMFEQIEYLILEPSPRRRQWQKETLAGFENKIRHISLISHIKQISALKNQPRTIIFSNELLDAFPIHRYGWDAKNKKWFEWGVAVEGEKFVWAKISNSQFAIRNSQLESVLPDGYIIETSPAAENWWREAASVLEKGKLLAIDYGFADDELFSPSRANGTLRAYFRHHVTHDILANAGEQDLTAHVNFSAIQKAGEETGLKTDFFGTQSKFLTEILKTQLTIRDSQFAISPRQFQTLTHPEHFGRAFRVLVQSR